MNPRRWMLSLWTMLMMMSPAFGSWQAPIAIESPPSVSPHVWPIIVGVPLPQGACTDAQTLTVVDGDGQAIPCQITPRATWHDGSLRWVHAAFNAQPKVRYALTPGQRVTGDDDIHIEQNEQAIVVETGGASYHFQQGDGSFRTLTLHGRTLVNKGQNAFFVIDSQGRRGTLRGQSLTIETQGPRHVVVRVQGEYLAEGEARNAAAVVYFSFHAGLPWCHISHKLIVTEETLDLWFRDIGMTLPLAIGAHTARFNDHHDEPTKFREVRLEDRPAVMVQSEFPHFSKQASTFTLRQGDALLAEGTACGDWASVGDDTGGIAMQTPAFAEQFPKAFVASADRLTLKLWAGEETKQELDYRTEKIIPGYFGSDWIPADHASMTVPNSARGSAKTHDIWVYPYAGAFDEQPRQFAGTAQAIYAAVDPAWVCASGAFGPIHPVDTERFGDVEHVIDDYFKRTVLVGQKIFPSTGYLYWGMYPFSSQPWEVRDGRWYPTPHRMSRSLEYNLKRMMWVLYARSGERQYQQYARKYTRLCHDLLFSNWDAGSKPKGWIMQGFFNTPIVWGAWGESTIRAGKKPSIFNNSTAAIAVASSEDVIQFSYDWLINAEPHSRDMALNWKEAMIEELQWDAEKGTTTFFPSVVFLRILGSVYEIDQDPRVYEFGHQILQRTIDPQGVVGLNDQIKQNYGKAGDVFSAFFYYWVSTGDELALVPLTALAQFDYQMARMDFTGRSSAVPYAYATSLMQREDPGKAAALATFLRRIPQVSITLDKLGVDFDQIDQQFTGNWGQTTMTGAGPIFYGLPAAMKAVVDHNPPAIDVPLALKPIPTARTTFVVERTDRDPATVEVYVNIVGDPDALRPRLLDAAGQERPLQVEQPFRYRVTKPPGTPGYEPSYDPYYLTYETHVFWRLTIGDDVEPGTYELDFGDEVAWKVLRCDLPRAMQYAPQGVVMLAGERYTFNVPSGVEHVDVFVHRPIEVSDPDGKVVALEALGPMGMHRFTTGGRGGVWAIQTLPDRYLTPGQAGTDSFVRFDNIPMLISSAEAQMLFDAGDRFGATPLPAPLSASHGETFVEAKFGQGALLSQQYVELPLDALAADQQPPREQGTIEFWYCPQWSATDFDMPLSTQRFSLLRLGPLALDWNMDNPNSGRTARYNEAKLLLRLDKAGDTRADAFFQRGKWYHIALTWRVDGADSQMDIYINGRKRSYAHYYPGMARATPASDLTPGVAAMRFGACHSYGRGWGADLFDDLRVSRTIRYHEDFEPPTQPLPADVDTWLLLPFDGSLNGTLAGDEVVPTLKSALKMD